METKQYYYNNEHKAIYENDGTEDGKPVDNVEIDYPHDVFIRTGDTRTLIGYLKHEEIGRQEFFTSFETVDKRTKRVSLEKQAEAARNEAYLLANHTKEQNIFDKYYNYFHALHLPVSGKSYYTYPYDGMMSMVSVSLEYLRTTFPQLGLLYPENKEGAYKKIFELARDEGKLLELYSQYDADSAKSKQKFRPDIKVFEEPKFNNNIYNFLFRTLIKAIKKSGYTRLRRALCTNKTREDKDITKTVLKITNHFGDDILMSRSECEILGGARRKSRKVRKSRKSQKARKQSRRSK